MDLVSTQDIAMFGRQQNAVVMKYNKTIIITTDILKWNDGNDRGKKIEPSIMLSDITEKIDIFAKEIAIAAKDSQRDYESVVYGESLVELLKWIITTMKTHTHPPNAPAIPDFHVEANTRMLNMEHDLLNKRVKTR